MPGLAATFPILSCDASLDFERGWFGGDEAREWDAMGRAGRAVAAAVLRDFEEIGGFPRRGRVLVLVGKGHNGGDALLAAAAILQAFPEAEAEVVFAFGERALRPLAARAWRALHHCAGARVRSIPPDIFGTAAARVGGILPVTVPVAEAQVGAVLSAAVGAKVAEVGAVTAQAPDTHAQLGVTPPDAAAGAVGRESEVVRGDGGLGACGRGAGAKGSEGGVDARGYDLCLDGVFGFQFRPPAERAIIELLSRSNALPIRLRAAVDLPSAGLFRADFTYATGSVKAPVVGAADAGRVRYLDLGFFRGDEGGLARGLTTGVLAPLAALRSAQSDKRTYGHVFIVGGSRSYPGAVLMTVLAALQSGAGLVTAFVPESVAAAFAARAPEAMWVAWPETARGGLALEGEHLLREQLERASALIIGPGLGREPETLALAASIAGSSPVPLLVDADALQRPVILAGGAARILTPHAGEFARVSAGQELSAFARDTGAVVVLKGPVTRIARRVTARLPGDDPVPGKAGESQAGAAVPDVEVYHSFFGGPVLARGGSGDVLAGLIGGLLAQTPGDPLLAAARGVVWHGRAADLLARAVGPTSARVTQLLDFLSAALRESAHDQRDD